MDRLTAIAPNGMAYLVKVKPSEQDVESPYPNTLNCVLESFKRLAEYEDTGLTPEEIRDLEKELGIVQNKLCQYLAENKQLKEQRMNDIAELQDLSFVLIDEHEKCNYWELEAKKYCSALGEQKIKLQKLKCEMCKDIGNCSEC